MLKPFGLKPAGTVRINGSTAKGYYRHQFEEAWARYLSPAPAPDPQGVHETSQRHNPTAAGTSATFRNVTADGHVTDEKCEKRLCPSDCDVVTFQKGGNGLARVCDHCRWPETGDNPLLQVLDGEERHLHRACLDQWTALWNEGIDDNLDIPAILRRTA
jgi:hypothetical protein